MPLNEKTAKSLCRLLSLTPLAWSFIIFPLAVLLVKTAGGGPDAGTSRFAWLALACLGYGFSVSRDMEDSRFKYLAAGVTLGAIVGICVWASEPFFLFMPALGNWLIHLSPFFYLLFACLWLSTMGPPQSGTVLRFAAALTAMAAIQYFASAFWPKSGMSFGHTGYGALLLAGWCQGLDKDKKSHLLIWPLAGLILLKFRIGIFAAAMAALFFSKGGIIRKVFMCVTLLTAALLIPWQRPDSMAGWHQDVILTWVACLKFWIANPEYLLTGVSFSTPLPFGGSDTLRALLAFQGLPTQWGSVGLSQITPFWLRLTLSFGLAAPIAVFAAGIWTMISRPSRVFAGSFTCMVIAGFADPLFYSDMTGPVLFILLMAPATQGVASR